MSKSNWKAIFLQVAAFITVFVIALCIGGMSKPKPKKAPVTQKSTPPDPDPFEEPTLNKAIEAIGSASNGIQLLLRQELGLRSIVLRRDGTHTPSDVSAALNKAYRFYSQWVAKGVAFDPMTFNSFIGPAEYANNFFKHPQVKKMLALGDKNHDDFYPAAMSWFAALQKDWTVVRFPTDVPRILKRRRMNKHTTRLLQFILRMRKVRRELRSLLQLMRRLRGSETYTSIPYDLKFKKGIIEFKKYLRKSIERLKSEKKCKAKALAHQKARIKMICKNAIESCKKPKSASYFRGYGIAPCPTTVTSCVRSLQPRLDASARVIDALPTIELMMKTPFGSKNRVIETFQRDLIGSAFFVTTRPFKYGYIADPSRFSATTVFILFDDYYKDNHLPSEIREEVLFRDLCRRKSDGP